MCGVTYGYIVINLRKPKNNFCLSIGVSGSQLVDRTMRNGNNEIIGNELRNVIGSFSTNSPSHIVIANRSTTCTFHYSC